MNRSTTWSTLAGVFAAVCAARAIPGVVVETGCTAPGGPDVAGPGDCCAAALKLNHSEAVRIHPQLLIIFIFPSYYEAS
jgi:hypothetical protein